MHLSTSSPGGLCRSQSGLSLINLSLGRVQRCTSLRIRGQYSIHFSLTILDISSGDLNPKDQILAARIKVASPQTCRLMCRMLARNLAHQLKYTCLACLDLSTALIERGLRKRGLHLRLIGAALCSLGRGLNLCLL